MELSELARNWDLLGKQQAITAIISTLGTEDEKIFFETGLTEIKWLLEMLQEEGITPADPVLDFGCGIGRLTQALSHYFTEVIGLDIAASMLKVAEEKNAFPDRCSYVLNQTDNLGIFEDNRFSLIVSSIVLQHVGQDLAKSYLKEMIRVLKPGGVLFFQIPAQLKEIPIIEDTACRTKISVDLSGYTDALQPATTPPSVSPEHSLKLLRKIFEVKSRAKTPVGSDTVTKAPDSLFQANAGEVLVLPVEITNTSEIDWKAEHMVSLGRRWLSYPEGLLLAYADDGGRVPLASGLESQNSVTVDMELRTPVKEGNYWLELDLSQPGRPLFADLGSKRYLLPVQISTAQNSENMGHTENAVQHVLSDDQIQETVLAEIEMHGIGRQEVEELLLDKGAEIIRVMEDNSAGESWQSYRYLARKP